MKRTFVVFLLALVASGVSPPAQADFICIPACALLPANNYSGKVTQWSTNGATMQIPPLTMQNFLAPLILPQHAVIKSVTMETYDNSGGEFGGYIRADLARFKYNTVSVIISSKVLDTGLEEAPGNIRVIAEGGDYRVDNSEYSYGLRITINDPTKDWGTLMFYKFIVEYDVPQVVISGRSVSP